MTKHKLKYFTSYAHKTEKLAVDLLELFTDHAALHREFEFEKWIDQDIILGEDWHQQIQAAIQECDFGLLLLSSTYFTRRYIKENELNHFVDNKGGTTSIIKGIIPVGLESFDLGGDLLGLEKTQIYRYQKTPGAPLKFYNQCRGAQKIEFVQDLIKKMTLKFNK